MSKMAPYLAWAYMEAAPFALHFQPAAQRFYRSAPSGTQRKKCQKLWKGEVLPLAGAF